MVSRVVNLALRGFEFLMTLLIMALIGNIIATAFAGNPSLINYDMFVAVFAMLSLIYLTAIAFNDGFTGHSIIPITLDALNAMFFFIAAIAMAAELGVHSCGNRAYTTSNHITNGSPDTNKRCTEAQASTAFFWFGWAAWMASLFFSVVSSRGSLNMRGPSRPQMSKV